MESNQMWSLARRLLKCALRRHVYERNNDSFQELACVEEGLYSDLHLQWVQVVESNGKLTDPVYRDRVREVLHKALPEARATVLTMFSNLSIESEKPVEDFVARFQSETYLP